MALPNENLARSLDELSKLKGDGIIKASELSRTHKDRLIANGVLTEVSPGLGWYIENTLSAKPGESTFWYASLWNFSSKYLEDRFGDQYHLSADSSLAMSIGTAIPNQISVQTTQNVSQILNLPFSTSMVIWNRKSLANVIKKDGVNVMALEDALCEVSESFFESKPIDAEIALKMIRDPSDILRVLLSTGKSTIAGRLAGAYRFVGKPEFADEIVSTMKSLGYDVRENNPFKTEKPMLSSSRITSPYAERIRASWALWRDEVELIMPEPTLSHLDAEETLSRIDDIYTHDAYNSLSIEGYRVTSALIDKVRAGSWNAEENEEDAKARDAMAAKGYAIAFEKVKEAITEILNGADSQETIRKNRQSWLMSLFLPSVQAGIIPPASLAGFRNNPVFIRDSKHVPPQKDHLADCIEALNDCMRDEKSPAVRAVLGHFFLVFIHPYMDGNGRTTRFMMNATLATSGYPWTVVQNDNKKEYFAALEKASAGGQITEFAEFIKSELECSLKLNNKFKP